MLPTETKRIKVEDTQDSDVDNIDAHSVWTRFGKVQLSKLDLKEIDSGDWLSDNHINFAQNIIKSQFNIQGLQNTLLQKSCVPSVNELQIVHTRGNHWIVASTILSFPDTVTVYDSLYDEIDFETSCIILKLFNDSNNRLKLEMAGYRSNMELVTVGFLPLLMQCC